MAKVPVAPPEAPPAARVAALLDIISEREAKVMAVVGDEGWQAPELAAAGTIERLTARGVFFQPIVAATGESAGSSASGGELAGGRRTDCGDYYVPLAKPATLGFAAVVVGGIGKDCASVASPRLEVVKVEGRHIAAVTALLKRVTKRKIRATIERAYRLDLDGNGKPELLLQATHPDLNGDPAKLKPSYYSLIVAFHDGQESEPAFLGYLQAIRDFADFEVLTLDSAADLNLDGKPELLVRACHAEGWQTQVFGYDGGLKELFRSVGGEGECPEGKD